MRSARGARAIQGLQPFASEVTHCLRIDEKGDLQLQIDRLTEFAKDRQDAEVLVYGFTFILWNHLVKPLMSEGITLNLPKARILHSGGWKRLHYQASKKKCSTANWAALSDVRPSGGGFLRHG